MINKTNKKGLLIFSLLILMLMMLPISFADDISGLNQTNDNIQAISDDSSEIISDSEKDIYVSMTGNDSTGHGTYKSPYGSLEKALEQSTATKNNIYLANGTYNESILSIKSNVNIFGSENTIIDAKNSGQMFNVNMNLVYITLNNLTFKNIYATVNGGLLNFNGYNPTAQCSDITLNSVNFINCYSTKSGSVIYDRGGSQAYPKNNLTIINCNFIGCSSPSGAVIYSKANTNIINSTFLNNKIELTYNNKTGAITNIATGSAVSVTGYASVNIMGCIFKNNFADSVRHESGAIYTSSSSLNYLNVNNNVFINNSNYAITGWNEASGSKINADNNWWGTNSPDFSSLLNNVNINSYATLNLMSDMEIVDIDENATIITNYCNNGTETQNNLIPIRNITLTTTGGNLDENKASFKGEFTTNFSSSSIGKYTITATVDNQILSTDITVRDLSDKTFISADYEVNYKDVTISVTVAPKSSTGNVTFTLNGKEEIIYLNEGKGNITIYNLPLNEYDNILLKYNGDENHNSSSTTVSFIIYENYLVEFTSNAIVNASDVSIFVELNSSNVTGSVTFTLNGNNEIIYLNGGKGNITITNLANGDYDVELIYNGDANFQTSINTVNFTISNRAQTELIITPIIEGDNVTIHAKLNETEATGNVSFYLKYKNQIINLINGEGNVTVKGITNNVYNITFYYSGDIDYAPSNTTKTFTVSVRKDSILTAEATVKNQMVTIDADINYITASGNVTFTINGEDKIINITRSKGSIILENVPYDNYSILLSYNGDINFNPSTYTLDFKVIYYQYGETLYVSKSGNNNNNGSSHSPLLTVSKAIDIANNYLNVKKIYIYNGNYNEGNITIERSIEIEGQSKENTIIDAKGSSLITIYGQSNNVSISNLTLKNGVNSNGGAIRDYGYCLNVTNCIFINNTANDQGGAIYHYYGSANIENSEFYQNIAFCGGAVHSSADGNNTFSIMINKCLFIENNALNGVDAGGAIYNYADMYINNTKFISNEAVCKSNQSYIISGGDGGAIYNKQKLYVENSEFIDNHALYWGGAIHSSNYLYVLNSNFTANSAGSRGGAIHTSGSGSYSAWTSFIDGCNFDSNIVGIPSYGGRTIIGGAICAESPTAIRDSIFNENMGVNGGAIYMNSNAKFIDNCTFIKNTAYSGGAICDNRTQSIISNSIFKDNNATLGGAVAVFASRTSSESGFTNLTSNIYINNAAENGGAIYSDAGYAAPQELNIKYSEFINNSANDSGSIIYTTNRANIEYNAIIYETNDNNVIYAPSECEGIISLENNWWGINSPLLSRIIRGISSPDIFAVLNLTANPQKIGKEEKSTITARLLWNDSTDKDVNLIPFRDITLDVAGANLTNDSGVLNPGFESKLYGSIGGTYNIIANVDNEIQYVTVNIIGDIEYRDVVYVNSSNGDDKFGDGSINNPVKTIARAISLVNDNGAIIMNGNFKGNGNTRIFLSSYIDNITFIGVNNVIIDGEHKNFIISISDGEFKFINLTFKNAYGSGYGSALINQAGTIQVENCTFQDNVAQGSAAIDNTGSVLVSGCNFINNIATIYDGGALSSNWEMIIINSSFINNRAYQNGGAMKNYEGGYLYIEGCEFKNNEASGSSDGSYGGAVYSWASQLEIIYSNFTDNYANTKGGAIYASFGNSIGDYYCFVMSSVFEGNNAPSGSTLFLERVIGKIGYNVFLDDNNVIYTYGKTETIDNNWWGVNTPNWDSLCTGTIKKPNIYAILNVSAKPDTVTLDFKSDLNYEFYWNGTTNQENTSFIPQRTIKLSSTGGKLNDSIGNLTDAKFQTSFAADKAGIYEITANVDNEILIINVTVKDSSIIIKPSANVNANDVVIDVSLTPNNITANLTFNLNGTTYVIPVVNGEGSITLNDLPNANYTINIEFAGDDEYPYTNQSSGFSVNNIVKGKSSVTVSTDVDMNNVMINVQVSPGDAKGNVKFTIDDKNYILPISDGKANISIFDLNPGNYTFNVMYSGDDRYNESESGNKSFIINNIIISAPVVEKYYGGSERFRVKVTDLKGNPIFGQLVEINIGERQYNKTTNANGTVTAPLGLNSGLYNVTVKVNDTVVNSTAIIKSTVEGRDVLMIYKNGSQYLATFKDTQGNYLAEGTVIEFNINGVMYERNVRSNGIARLNLNLEQGNYVITALNTKTGERCANNITILSSIIENRDITKYYRNGTQYTVKVLGKDGNPIGKGMNVIFNINGMFYTRTTNNQSIAKLNINLQPGDYVITAEYAGCRVSNNIRVLPVLSANDLTKKYGGSEQFISTLVNGQGSHVAGEKILFNINGVFYERTTNYDGQAKLNIKLQAGEYIITSTYNGASIANKVTVTA